MTSNQIAFWANEEKKRSNIENEAIKRESNRLTDRSLDITADFNEFRKVADSINAAANAAKGISSIAKMF